VLSQRFRNRGIEVVGIGLRETPPAMQAFAREFGSGFPLWIDPEGHSPEVFGVWGHPSAVLIDRAGRIVGRIPGERDWGSDDARRLVEWLLGTKP
jgi:peroxiredoxin